MTVRRLLPAAVAFALLPWAASAQTVGNAAAGEALAKQWCAECHLVGRDARGVGDFAAPFAEIAADAKTTEFRLRAFLRTPHHRMPDYRLSRDQTDDIVSYILSLKRR